MKKTLLTYFLVFAARIVLGQNISYGIKGGINFSEQSIKNAFFKSIQSQYVTGFNVGGVVELEFQKFSLQPGIFFSTKGENLSSTAIIGYQNSQQLVTIANIIKSNYIDVPVNFLYRMKISKALLIHLGGGPYVAYELSATATGETYQGSGKIEKIAISYDNPDYGLNFNVGLKINNKFTADVDYGLGLANIASAGTTENRVLSFSVGCIFR